MAGSTLSPTASEFRPSRSHAASSVRSKQSGELRDANVQLVRRDDSTEAGPEQETSTSIDATLKIDSIEATSKVGSHLSVPEGPYVTSDDFISELSQRSGQALSRSKRQSWFGGQGSIWDPSAAPNPDRLFPGDVGEYESGDKVSRSTSSKVPRTPELAAETEALFQQFIGKKSIPAGKRNWLAWLRSGEESTYETWVEERGVRSETDDEEAKSKD